MQDALQETLTRLQKLTEEQAATIEELRATLAVTQAQVQYLLKQRYSSKTEAIDPRQLELLLRGQENSEPEEKPKAEAPVTSTPQRPRAPRKPRLPKAQPRLFSWQTRQKRRALCRCGKP